MTEQQAGHWKHVTPYEMMVAIRAQNVNVSLLAFLYLEEHKIQERTRTAFDEKRG
jgi:hypothetical protein